MQKCDNRFPDGRPVPEPYNLYGIGQGNSPEIEVGQPQRDLEYFQSLYPARMQQIQSFVKDACDRMDYKNSPMYDEYPDRIMIDRMCLSICQRISCGNGESTVEYSVSMEPGDSRMGRIAEVEEVEAYDVAHAQSLLQSAPRPPWGPPPPPPPRPPWGPPPPPPPRPPWGPPPPRPPQGPNWMNDIVKIMLLNEMFNRRCRNGRCY